MGNTKVTSSRPDNSTLEDGAHLYLVCVVMGCERFSARTVCFLLVREKEQYIAICVSDSMIPDL
jgi:hypothetical protein